MSTSTAPETKEKQILKTFNVNTNPMKTYLPYVEVQSSVSSKPLRLLVDSGASISLIKVDSIETMPEILTDIINFTGIGNAESPIASLGHIRIKFNTLNHKFHVIPNLEFNYDGIIGNDFLTLAKCKIDYIDKVLSIANKTWLDLKFNDPTYIIPPRTETIVECSVSNPNIKEGLVLDQLHHNNLLIANCIVKVKDNKRINISVVNTSDVPVPLKSNLNITLIPLKTYHDESVIAVNSINNINSQPVDSYQRTQEILNLLRVSHLNEEEANALHDVCSEFSDIFHIPGDKLSYTSAINHKIVTTSDIPIHTKSYRFPDVHKEVVNKQIKDMLDQGIIEPSSSPWSSPIWVVPKKLDASGERKWRIVIDYRKLNDVTVGDSYPIPQISEILDQLGQSKYFSTLDLASGFHQIKMNDADALKTAFNVPQGHYQFNRMPFGLKNAPATFQRLMNTALSGLQGVRCFVYLDDIVIYSHDLNSHIENLTSIFQKLRNFNLKLQPDKCEFLRREVAYLGHVITEQGVKPNPDKIKAVTEFPTPRSAKDIKSFLGLVSYYRRFIPDFSKTAKALTNLLKKDITFKWENQQQLAFDTLKRNLTTAPLLIYPDFTKPFILTCDASNHAVGAILSQGEIGKDQPVAYASRTLNKSESNYNTTEKELLAILYGCKTFRPYLYGRKFQIVTDHRPLRWLFNHKDPSSKLQRWRLKLEEYEYEIVYRKGRLNSAADALSRYPVNPVLPENKVNLNPNTTNDTYPDSNIDNPVEPLIPEISQESLDEFLRTATSPLEDALDLDFTALDSPPVVRTDASIDQSIIANPPTVIDPLPVQNKRCPEIEEPQPSTRWQNPENLPVSISLRRNSSTTSPIPENLPLLDETYSKFLKSTKKLFNAEILEHNESLLKGKQKLIIVPTSVDMDESMPYVQEILSNCANDKCAEFLRKERTLHKYLPLIIEDKTYLFLFTKVYHFEENSYPEIFNSLKYTRDEIVMSYPTINEISISDFKNPFDKHSFTKIYNMLAYLFDGNNIKIHIYHNNVIYPTPSEIPKILKENHDIPIAGHLGTSRMLSRIKERFAWKNMSTDIENYVKKCELCQSNKALRKINRAPMVITSTSTSPFERLAIDIVGPLPESGTARLKYILTMQDDLTKFSCAYPIRSTTAEETSECLLHFISIFGIPKLILTDQGTNFTSDLFKKTCDFLKIKNLWSTPYHPQTQGALERSHSTLKEYLKSYINEDQTNWPQYVYTAMLAYNTSVHSTTHFTPHELVFGNKPFIPNSIFDSPPGTTYPDYVRMLQNRLKLSREKALEFINKSKESSKTYYDSHTRPVKYKTGDYVYLKNHLRLRKALSPIWKGPYKVVKVNGNNTLTLLINRRHIRHHVDQVKPATDVDRNL